MEPERDAPLGVTPDARASLDPEFFERLHRTQAEPLRRFVLGLLRDVELAEDVVQTTFAKAVEQGASVSTDAWKSWLFRVAYHEAMTLRRRGQVRAAGDVRLARDSRSGWLGPEDVALREETIQAVRKALSQLSDDQRRVVHARLYDGLTFAEIADRLGVPIGTVLARMRRALERLRRSIEPETP